MNNSSNSNNRISPQTQPESTTFNSDWAELTQECLLNILSRLTLEDRWKGAMFVCKPWLYACMDSTLHESLDLDHFFDSATELAHWWSSEFERRVDCIIKSVVVWSCGLLREVRVRHCSDEAVVFVAQRCPKLEILTIKSSQNVSDAAMVEVAKNCPMLRELDISYCHEISHESLALIGRSCPDLRILKRNFMNWLDSSQHKGIVPNGYLDALPQDGDSEASAIAKYMLGLEVLEIRFSKLTGKGLSLISEGCLKLNYLDIYGCANLTSRDVSNVSSNLRSLTVNKPNFYIPRSVFHTERYGHWRLYDERFQTDVFRI